MDNSFIRAFIQPSDIGKSRTSTLTPLQWIMAILLSGLLGLILTKAPSGYLVLLAVMLAANFVLMIVAYVYFMFKSPDCLRSESYNISKMAIEKGMFGDSLSGIKALDVRSSQTMTAANQNEENAQ